MPLPRLAWLITVVLGTVMGLILVLDGFTGYGFLTFAVAASAAINLF